MLYFPLALILLSSPVAYLLSSFDSRMNAFPPFRLTFLILCHQRTNFIVILLFLIIQYHPVYQSLCLRVRLKIYIFYDFGTKPQHNLFLHICHSDTSFLFRCMESITGTSAAFRFSMISETLCSPNSAFKYWKFRLSSCKSVFSFSNRSALTSSE